VVGVFARASVVHEIAMATLTISAEGQITLDDDLLKHLGMRPGQQITIEKLSDGQIVMKAFRPTGKISDVFGRLKRKDGLCLSIEEMTAIGPPTT
jgi:bifunctional DNA-binding transcriptional regulator/antitoxin component of YhaV-PrlF toxin-antitoxin module